MSISHKRSFKSYPAQMGHVINELIGGAHLPVYWFDESEKKWKQPIGSIQNEQYGELSVVVDFSMIPQESWDKAYLVDVQMRIQELWPDLKLKVIFEGGLVGYYAKLVNTESCVTVGTGIEQTWKPGYGETYSTGPDNRPQRSSYNTDVSKLVIHFTNRGKLFLVNSEGDRLTGDALKGDNHPEDFAWVIAKENYHPREVGVRYSDLLTAARLTGNELHYTEDGMITF